MTETANCATPVQIFDTDRANGQVQTHGHRYGPRIAVDSVALQCVDWDSGHQSKLKAKSKPEVLDGKHSAQEGARAGPQGLHDTAGAFFSVPAQPGFVEIFSLVPAKYRSHPQFLHGVMFDDYFDGSTHNLGLRSNNLVFQPTKDFSVQGCLSRTETDEELKATDAPTSTPMTTRAHGANFTNDSRLKSCLTQIKDVWIEQQLTPKATMWDARVQIAPVVQYGHNEDAQPPHGGIGGQVLVPDNLDFADDFYTEDENYMSYVQFYKLGRLTHRPWVQFHHGTETDI